MSNKNVCIPSEMFDDPKIRATFDIKNSLEREAALGNIFGPQYAKALNAKFGKMKLLKSFEDKSLELVDSLIKSETKEGKQAKAEISQKIKEAFDKKKTLLKSLQDAGEIADTEILSIEKMADDIFNKKHGYEISEKQASEIISLTNAVKESSKLPKTASGDFDLKYGIAIEALDKYTANIKNPTANMSLKKELQSAWNTTSAEFKDMGNTQQKIAYVLEKVLKISTSSAFKNMKATADLSFLGIQGIAVLTTNPIQFFKSSAVAFKMLFAKNPEDAMSAFRAIKFSKKRYTESIDVGLRVFGREEQTMSALPEKLPAGLGGLIKRTDNAFSAFLQDVRFNEYTRYADSMDIKFKRKLDHTDSNLDELISKEVEKRIGGKSVSQEERNKIIDKVTKTIVPDSQLLKEAASEANKISGTSNLGPAERFSGIMNSVLFAARFTVSDIRMLTDVLSPTISSTGRIRAIKSLSQNLALTYGTYLALSKLFPDQTDPRPNSANFMKFKDSEGNTWGFPKIKGQWIYTLAAKIMAGSEINSKGKVVKYGDGYGQKNRGSVIQRLVRGKLAPVPSVITDVVVGSDFMGNKATFGREAVNLTLPIFGTGLFERLLSDKSTSLKIKQSVYEIIGQSAY